MQYENISVDYDEDINDDNDVRDFFLGVEMQAISKIRARIKVGYGEKKFDQTDDYN